MKRYHIYGGTLLSDVELPELREAENGTPTWTLRVTPTVAERTGRALGEKEIAYGASVRLSQLEEGSYRLEYTDTGTFDVSQDGSQIAWTRRENTPDMLARMDIMSLVLSTALHASGAIALHASAVAAGEGGIGFCAPKFYGKSTLALALTYAGARLLTDDTLAITPDSPPMCIPGVHSVRLRSESAARFPRTRDLPAPPTPEGRIVDELPPEQLMLSRVPLAALYLLTPVPADGTRPAVVRRPLPAPQAAVSILSFAKMGELFRAADATTNFERATAIASHTPVYALEIARDMALLDEVTETILGWHRGSA
jgi:hypothetical protein